MLLIVVGLGVLAALVILYGALRWQSSTRGLVFRLEEARASIHPPRYDSRELAGLPPPVQRYFRAVLNEGQPLVAMVTVTHAGTFNMSESGEQWRRFTSIERIVTNRPGFVWDGRITMMPGVAVRVHDAYVGGEGILQATLFGFVTLADMRGTPEVAQGELIRFLAEAAWYPTAHLPSQGVRWEAVDDMSAKVTLRDGQTTSTILCRFNQAGLIESVRAEARGRAVKCVVVPTPWEGRGWHYDLRDGMRIPLEGEVAWQLPDRLKPYWRGCVTSVTYEFAP